MKLSTSTGDFSWYVPDLAGKVRCFKDTKFRYINLEQTGSIPELLMADDTPWRRLVDAWGEAAEFAGIRYVVSHAPCMNPFRDLTQETYDAAVLAIRRSIMSCHYLGIPRIVVHYGSHPDFTEAEFAERNRKFYGEFFDLMEKHNIIVMTENMHDMPGVGLSTGEDMREFLAAADHPLLAACWDTAHGNLSKKAKAAGQYACITALGDTLKGLHISDNFGDGAHHHSWPFAGIINFDEVLQGLLDVHYDGFFNFEASYTLLHQKNQPYSRKAWTHEGETVTKLLNPSVELKKKAVDLLYDVGKYMLESYGCFEE